MSSSSSKPSTPLASCRHQFSAEPTRIPQPSPQPLRRSLSLRLRRDSSSTRNVSKSPNGNNNNIDCDYTHPNNSGGGGGCDPFVRASSTVSSPSNVLATAITTSTSGNNINFRKEKLSNSKSLSSIAGGTMAHCYNSKDSPPSTIPNGILPNQNYTSKCSPVASSAVVAANVGGKHNASGNHDHGMSLNLNHCGASTSTTPQNSHQHHHNHHHRCGSQRTIQSPLTPTTPSGSTIPKLSPKTPPVTPDDPLGGYADDDLDSVYSYTSVASGRSTMSCDHPFVARNGTTFSGRKMKYVVHCSSYAGQTGEDYLTPTQRAQKHIRRLKVLLSQAHMDLEQRDSEILRLTKEVVELRLFKASLSSPEERSNSSDAVTVRENDPKTSTDVSPIVDQTDDALTKSTSSPRHIVYQHDNLNTIQYLEKMTNSEMQSSFADSGHFEDITTSSVNSKNSFVQTHDIACGNDNIGIDRSELIKFYEQKIEELIKNHSEECQEVKVTHNDRVEALLQKLADCNTRYADLVPDYEQAKERIRELEKQLEDLQQKLQEQEDKQNKMYLHMFAKGQEAERISNTERVLEIAQQSSSRVSVPELMQQLQITQNELENIKDTNYVQGQTNAQVLLSAKEAISLWLLGARKTMYRRLIDAQQTKNKVDPEVTLQFLKSAIYYFLTDKENTQGHLKAIESILGFSELEKLTIDRARAAK